MKLNLFKNKKWLSLVEISSTIVIMLVVIWVAGIAAYNNLWRTQERNAINTITHFVDDLEHINSTWRGFEKHRIKIQDIVFTENASTVEIYHNEEYFKRLDNWKINPNPQIKFYWKTKHDFKKDDISFYIEELPNNKDITNLKSTPDDPTKIVIQRTIPNNNLIIEVLNEGTSFESVDESHLEKKTLVSLLKWNVDIYIPKTLHQNTYDRKFWMKNSLNHQLSYIKIWVLYRQEKIWYIYFNTANNTIIFNSKYSLNTIWN